MAGDRVGSRAGVFEVLEMLVSEAPPLAFEELVHDARRAGASKEELDELLRAKELALRVHALFGRRQQREAGLAALVDTARDLTMSFDVDDLLRVITRRSRLLLNLDMSYISLFEPETGDGYVRTADGAATALTVGFRVPASSGLGGDVAGNYAPFQTHDYMADDRIRHHTVIDEVVRAEGLHAIMAVPLRHGETFFGVLYVADRNVRRFSPEEVALMSSLADLAAVAIEKARLLDQAQADITKLEQDSFRTNADLTAEQQVNHTHSKMIDLVLGGGELNAIAQLAGETLNSALLFRSPSNQVLATSGTLPELDETAVVKASLDSQTGRVAVLLEDGIWVTAISEGSEHLGTLLVAPREPLTDSGQRLLQLAAKTAAILLLVRRNIAVAESQVRDEFFDDLLANPQRPSQQLQERARRLALDLDRPHVVVVARPEGGSHNRASVWASSYAYRMNGLKSVRGGSIALLVPGMDPGGAARAAADELSPILGHPVTVGSAGPINSLEGISQAHREAVRCLTALAALGRAGASGSVADLGFLGVLLADDHDAEGFINRAIGPVLDYDAQRFTNLVRTLESYFDSGASPTYAAEELHVHPNTVSRRLERITELIGPDWQRPDRALDIQLALRLQRIRTMLHPPGEEGGLGENPGL